MSTRFKKIAIHPHESSKRSRCSICNLPPKDHGEILQHVINNHINLKVKCACCRPKAKPTMLTDDEVVAHGKERHRGRCPICKAKHTNLAEHFNRSCSAKAKAEMYIREDRTAQENAIGGQSGQSASCKEIFAPAGVSPSLGPSYPVPLPQFVQDSTPGFGPGSRFQQDFGGSQGTFTGELVDFQGLPIPNHESTINVQDYDLNLLIHFIGEVSKLVFPIRIVSQHGSARADVVRPALNSNKAYLHCCLSIAATHMKATEQPSSEEMDKHILRHRRAAVSELCGQLGQDVEHARMLEATLGMIYFQSLVGRPDDVLPDIPWHQHFQVAISLVHKLDLPSTVFSHTANGTPRPLFNMALTSWIDILGATMSGKAPTFADTYRELKSRQQSAGLAELMGCDDRIMFLISEIACLEVSKADGLDKTALYRYIVMLTAEIDMIHQTFEEVQSCISPTGTICIKQLNINISAAFCTAARIFLCTLEPGIELRHPSLCHFISTVSDVMRDIPAGVDGYDRSLVWPLLMAGSMSMADSSFRIMFAERCEALGDAANFGSFGRIRELLQYVWDLDESGTGQTPTNYPIVCWRKQIGGDHLLI